MSSTSRPSSQIHNPSMSSGTVTSSSSSSITSASASNSSKARQYAHLHAQLAQLSAHLADTENLVRVTAAQAGDMRFLGGYIGALFMSSARILGEESVGAGSGDGTA